MIHNNQETTWNDLQQPELTYSKQKEKDLNEIKRAGFDIILQSGAICYLL